MAKYIEIGELVKNTDKLIEKAQQDARDSKEFDFKLGQIDGDNVVQGDAIDYIMEHAIKYAVSCLQDIADGHKEW